MGFQEDMRDLVKHFKLLEREYEQWFSGALVTPPWSTQKKCENIVGEYSRNPPQNMSEQSIFAMHQAKFATHMEMWNRRMRLKEEGKLPTGRKERSKRVPRPGAPRDGGRGAGDEQYRKVFDSYVAAKQNAGEATAKLKLREFQERAPETGRPASCETWHPERELRRVRQKRQSVGGRTQEKIVKSPMRSLALTLLAAGFVLLVSSSHLEAWPKEAYRNMVYDTMRLMPPRLARVLLSRDHAILRGVTSLEGDTASTLARDGMRGQLSVDLVEDVEARIARVVRLVDEHHSLDEVAEELGRLLRIAADIADPAVLGAGSAELRRVVSEYYRFVGLNLTKFPLVHDGGLPSTVEGASVRTLLVQVASDTSASVSPLSKAFWQDGRVMPAGSFDYRSVPYAETSLSYSRGVTAAAYLWLSAWAKANGDFTGYRFGNKKP